MIVRAALIGAGGISGVHFKALRAMEDVKLVGVYDVQAEAAQKRGGEFDCAVFTDLDRMLDEAKPQAVWLATPPSVRREPVRRLVERGIAVMCEKPAAHTLAEAEDTARIIEAARGRVVVGYVYRHLGIADRLREHLAGDPPHLAISYYACPMTLDFMSRKPARAWFYRKEISGGGLQDQATHSLDFLRYLLGDAVEVACVGNNLRQKKQADYTVEDMYAARISFRNGMLASHNHSWLHERWVSRMTILCEKSICELDFNEQLLRFSNRPETADTRPKENWYALEDRRFVDMVKTGDFTASRSTYADAVKSLKLTCAALQSVEENGRPVSCA